MYFIYYLICEGRITWNKIVSLKYKKKKYKIIPPMIQNKFKKNTENFRDT